MDKIKHVLLSSGKIARHLLLQSPSTLFDGLFLDSCMVMMSDSKSKDITTGVYSRAMKFLKLISLTSVVGILLFAASISTLGAIYFIVSICGNNFPNFFSLRGVVCLILFSRLMKMTRKTSLIIQKQNNLQFRMFVSNVGVAIVCFCC